MGPVCTSVALLSKSLPIIHRGSDAGCLLCQIDLMQTFLLTLRHCADTVTFAGFQNSKVFFSSSSTGTSWRRKSGGCFLTHSGQ